MRPAMSKAGNDGVIVREFAIAFTLPRPGRVEEEINQFSRHHLTPKIPALAMSYNNFQRNI